MKKNKKSQFNLSVKRILFILGLHILFTPSINAQTKPSIAVANPNVVRLRTNSIITAKMLRLELIKMDNYIVYDEFDMEDIYTLDSNFRNNCLSKTCLIRLGKALEVDNMITGSYDLLGDKIVISLKMIDVKSGSVVKSAVHEFDNQVMELQRMTEIILKEMHDVELQEDVADRLKYKNEVITLVE